MNIWGKVIVFGLILCSAYSCKTERKKEMEKTRPYLLFIFADQYRQASLGFLKEDPVHTPNLDQLAKEGVFFSEAFSNNPLCSPYRAMLMTGRYPISTGVVENCNSQRTALGNYLKQFKGMTLGEAQKLLASEQVLGSKRSLKMLESLDMALLDVSGRLQNKPAVELLGLTGTNPVPGLYCILDKDEKKVKAEAERSIEQNLGHHLKFKMYGDEKVDMKLLKTIRDVLGDEAVVISDVNKGYKKWKSLDELKGILDRFSTNGLNAIEDPANLNTQQWIQLQEMVGDLTLIPDAPMRPAWKGINTIKKGMGHIYNLHPSTMGSLTHTAKLAHKVKAIGAKVMIGDDSLVGPACSAWQQIAIGVGATWVEAIEKKEDSKIYFECLQSTATKKESNGYYSFKSSPGFGLEIDTDRLKKVSELYLEV